MRTGWPDIANVVGHPPPTFLRTFDAAANPEFEKVMEVCTVNQAQSADVDQNHLSESATFRPVTATRMRPGFFANCRLHALQASLSA